MTYHTEVVPLDDYVKGVLPNEWLRHWEPEALKAGAIAVKQFAVTTYNRKGYLWDCNYDQVYNPSKRTPETDKAVDDTWNIWLLNNGIVPTFYDDYPDACASRGYECMSQYESQRLARQGYLLRFIILKNYKGTLIWLYN